uniref:CUB domain-containing protein n=1 Tax=Ditylenchus dipsaci TaxID=166011 RepID=A0A915E6A1_9BILA
MWLPTLSTPQIISRSGRRNILTFDSLSFIFLVFSSLLLLLVDGEEVPSGSKLLSRCKCQNKVLMLLREDDQRVIFSPQFPRPYCPSLNCLWRVMAGPDAASNTTLIHFSAKNVDLRRGRDFIHFHDNYFLHNTPVGDQANENLGNSSFNCTGNLPLCEYKSSSGLLTIQFISDGGVPDNYGFQGTVVLHDRQLKKLLGSRTMWSVFVAIGVGILLAVLLTVFLVYLLLKWWQRRRARRQQLKQLSNNSSGGHEDETCQHHHHQEDTSKALLTADK